MSVGFQGSCWPVILHQGGFTAADWSSVQGGSETPDASKGVSTGFLIQAGAALGPFLRDDFGGSAGMVCTTTLLRLRGVAVSRSLECSPPLVFCGGEPAMMRGASSARAPVHPRHLHLTASSLSSLPTLCTRPQTSSNLSHTPPKTTRPHPEPHSQNTLKPHCKKHVLGPLPKPNQKPQVETRHAPARQRTPDRPRIASAHAADQEGVKDTDVYVGLMCEV